MPTRTRHDAVVIGSGHNGLVAAACLARGDVPVPAAAEICCHTLTDDSILPPD
jgi:phytoene dehydrogenase-like protein